MAKTKKPIIAAFFCALTAILSQLYVPVGPVPFSLSVVGVFLSGALLDKKHAFLSQLIYLVIGAFGFPVFSGGGGLSKLLGPTGGFLLSYPVMAFLIAFIVERHGKSVPKFAASMLTALFTCYIIGTAWLTYISHSFIGAITSGVVPFIIPDLIKTALCAPLCKTLDRALKKI